MPGDLAGALSRHRSPLSPGESPCHALTPTGHLRPEIIGPLPPWGSDHWGRGARNWPKLRQTLRPLCPITLTAKNGGGPQEMAFIRASPGWFLAQTRGGQAQVQGRPLKLKPPLGQWAPHLTYLARFPGSLGSRPGNWKPSLTPRGPRVFPRGPHFPAGLPPLQGKSAQGRTRDLGPGRGAGQGSWPGGAGPGRRDPRPWTGSPVGS